MTVKPRDIRLHVSPHVHPNVAKYMQALAEDQLKLTQSVHELAQMIDKLIENFTDMVNGVGLMRDEILKQITGREKSATDMVRRKDAKDEDSGTPHTD